MTESLPFGIIKLEYGQHEQNGGGKSGLEEGESTFCVVSSSILSTLGVTHGAAAVGGVDKSSLLRWFRKSS
jgi:hypothetical protein